MQLQLVLRPYGEYTACQWSSPADVGRSVKPATLVALEIRRGTDLDDARRYVRELRRHAPWAVLVGRIRENVDPELLHIVQILGGHGLRTFVHDEEPLESTLRRRLTAPNSLGKYVPGWLTDVADAPGCGLAARIISNPEVFHLIRTVFRQPGMVNDVGGAARLLGRSERGLRRLMKSRRVSPPGAWLTLATQLLPDALALQRRDQVSLAATAVERGWSDQSALTRAFNHSFGWTPAQVARRLGWEWLMFAWLKRQDRS